MRHELRIFTNGEFQVRRGKESGVVECYKVAQKSDGTKVWRLDWKDENHRVTERVASPVTLKRKRYSLACVTVTPRCGYNFNDFQKDFWEAIEMEAQS